jgi:hypothetical protein
MRDWCRFAEIATAFIAHTLPPEACGLGRVYLMIGSGALSVVVWWGCW